MDLFKYFTKKPSLQVGVDIGSGALKLALLQISPNRIVLLAYKCEDISRFKDEEEKNNFILQQTVNFIKAYGLFKKSVHLNLSLTDEVYTKTVKLPHMPP